MKSEYTLGEILADVLAHVVPSESLAWLEIDISPDFYESSYKWEGDQP